MLIILFVAVLISTVIVFNSTAEQKSTSERHIDAMLEDGSLTNVVRLLASKGIICDVAGHHWEPGCGVVGCLVDHGGPMRHCTMCGEVQYQIWR